MKIYREHITGAICTAIRSREKYEREVLKYKRDSTMLYVWKEMLEALENKEELHIRD